MNRLAKAALLTLVAALALSGCIRYNVDMTLSSDDTASGTVVLAVQSGIGEQMDLGSDDEALAQIFGESPFGDNFTEEDYADGDWVGKSYTFNDVPIDELTDLADLVTVTHDGDNYVVQGPAAPMTEEDLASLPTGAESKLSITFPGEVTDTNGTIEGTTVTWDLFTATEAIYATGRASSGWSGVSSVLLIAGAIGLVVLLGAAATVFMVLRRRNAAPPEAPAPVDGVEIAPIAPADNATPVAEALTATDASAAPPAVDAAPEAPAAPKAARATRAPRKPKATATDAAPPAPEEDSAS